jgi:hypothetical protein
MNTSLFAVELAFAERGWEAEVGLFRPDETAVPTVERQLSSKSYDCVVIGAGVRLPPEALVYSKPSSTPFIGLHQARRLPSIHGQTIAPMLPPDGWRSPSRCSRTAVDLASHFRASACEFPRHLKEEAVFFLGRCGASEQQQCNQGFHLELF